MSQKTKARWKIIVTIVTFVALAGLIYAVRDQIVQSIHNLDRINTWALWLMLPLQFVNYLAYSKLYIGLLRILGERLRFRPMFRVMMELNFVNNVFPSGGVSGFSYFSLRMKDAEVSTAKSSLVHLMRLVLVFISFQILLFVGLICLAVGGQAGGMVLLVGGSLATLVLTGSFVIAYVIGSQRRINSFFGFVTKTVNRIIHIVRPKHPETINVAKAKKSFEELHENYMLIKVDYKVLKRPLLWALLANLAEVLTIYTVYVAFGQYVNPGAVILAYAVANFAGFISVLPGGVGIYEALMTGVLAASGVSPGISIPVTVMYRILNMLIQLPPGYYFYNKKLRTTSSVA